MVNGRTEVRRYGVISVLVVFVFLLISALTSCSPKIIERYIYQRDTTYINKVQVDSVFLRDSVFIREKGDTVYIYKERVAYKLKAVHDTVWRTKVDSVFVEKEKVVEVSKPLPWGKAAKIGLFWWLVAALAGCLTYIFRKPLIKLLKTLLKI